jgi:hypothetical protein
MLTVSTMSADLLCCKYLPTLTWSLSSVLPTQQIHVTLPQTGNTLLHNKTKTHSARLVRGRYSLCFQFNDIELNNKLNSKTF